MKRIIPILLGLIVFARPALAEPLVFESALADAWSKCDFSQLPHGGKKGHVMLIGDSNGALYGAKGVPLRYFEGDATTKDWAEFMQPAPAGGWRILNLAWWGNGTSVFDQPDAGLNQLRKCLDVDYCHSFNVKTSECTKRRQRFIDTTPDRVWMQLGGNDVMSYELFTNGIAMDLMPHYAHYGNNKILNRLATMTQLLNKAGKTVLHVSYHAASAQFVTSGDFRNQSLISYICGANPIPDGKEDDAGWNVLAPVSNGFQTVQCMIGNVIVSAINEVSTVVFDAMNKQIGWFYDRLGIRDDLVRTDFYQRQHIFRQMDLSLGRALGMGRSFTGLFEDPSSRFRAKNKDPLKNLGDAFKNGVPWTEFWSWLQKTPRGMEGWMVIHAQPNREKAKSAVLIALGQRFREIEASLGVPIEGTPRKSVEFVDLYPLLKDPHVDFASKNEYMADGVHFNEEGLRIYGKLVSEKFFQLGYDTALSDYNVQTGTWNTLPEDPLQEDLGWLLLCFYLGICKL